MTDELENALIEAIEDEYKAQATYAKVIQTFGDIRPFINIVEAEGRHIEALLPLFKKYDLNVPQDSWPNRIEVPESIQQACQAGVEAEIENAEMYNRLLTATINYNDVQEVFKNLQRASQENHLTAFQRCVERGSAGNNSSGGHGKGKHRHGRT